MRWTSYTAGSAVRSSANSLSLFLSFSLSLSLSMYIHVFAWACLGQSPDHILALAGEGPHIFALVQYAFVE